uniref:Transmembrane protein 65 n=1 Tax=Paramormyrops kingsleyae TaxID=1676925 RepID=A0A3B3Q825_9TELE
MLYSELCAPLTAYFLFPVVCTKGHSLSSQDFLKNGICGMLPSCVGALFHCTEKLEMAPPTAAQLRYVLLHNAIPFVGFGFLDNAIMIVAGTQIELSIGVILGISTMAAAALGNLVSDLAGLGLAGYVEALASRLGMQIPDLSPKQADMWQTRVSSHAGKAIGVGIGCVLGMFPLLFFKDDDEQDTKGGDGPKQPLQDSKGVIS